MPGPLDVVKVTLSGTNPDEMFVASLDLLVRQAEAEVGAILMIDLRSGAFEQACPPVGTDLAGYEPVRVGSQLTFVFHPDRPIETDHPTSPLVPGATENRVLDSTAEPDWDWASLGVGGDQHALLIPILRADTCLGFVLVARAWPFDRDDSDDHVDDLTASAQPIAAIYDHRTQFQLLGQMQTPLDLRQADAEFYGSVMELLVQSSGMEFITIRRLEPDGALTTLRASNVDAEASSIAPDSPLSAPYYDTIERRSSTTISSVAIEGLREAVGAFAPHERSFVVVPIVIGQSRDAASLSPVDADGSHEEERELDPGRVFGTLTLGCRVEYEYSPVERLGFRSLANSIGLAIENYSNVSRVSLWREKQVEAGAALQAQEMAQGFRHEIRKKLDNINGIFATDAPRDMLEEIVHRQTTGIGDVLDEWRNHARGVEYRWEWVNLAELWDEAIEHAEYQLGQAEVKVRDGQIPRTVQVFCSRAHFVRFVLDGMILNSVDAFRERKSRGHREIGLNYLGPAGSFHSLRYFDTAGGIRSDRVKGLQRRRNDWNELPSNEVIFEAGFSTKSTDTTGVGGGYGLHLARLTMTQHHGQVALVEAGEPGAVFDLRLPEHHIRGRAGKR
ncbi:MAG: ATP-binding protein [Actinomycetota bacterium]